MARSIDKGNLLTIDNFLISTDFLSDTTMLFSSDVAVTDGIDKSRLSVVNMSHNGNNWTTRIFIDIPVENRSLGEVF